VNRHPGDPDSGTGKGALEQAEQSYSAVVHPEVVVGFCQPPAWRMQHSRERASIRLDRQAAPGWLFGQGLRPAGRRSSQQGYRLRASAPLIARPWRAGLQARPGTPGATWVGPSPTPHPAVAISGRPKAPATASISQLFLPPRARWQRRPRGQSLGIEVANLSIVAVLLMAFTALRGR